MHLAHHGQVLAWSIAMSSDAPLMHSATAESRYHGIMVSRPPEPSLPPKRQGTRVTSNAETVVIGNVDPINFFTPFS